jgi:hypothetical protein
VATGREAQSRELIVGIVEAVEFVTWSDYEEGTELESGIAEAT